MRYKERLARGATHHVQSRGFLDGHGHHAEGIVVAQIGGRGERDLGQVFHAADVGRRQPMLVHPLPVKRDVFVGPAHHLT